MELADDLKAYHEAGHAVVATYQHALVILATIERGENDGDETAGLMQQIPLGEQDVFMKAVIAWAGYSAVKRFKPQDCEQGCAGDWNKVATLAMQIVGVSSNERADILKMATWAYAAQERAETLVEQNWPQIDALAKALLIHRTLHAADIRRIVAYA